MLLIYRFVWSGFTYYISGLDYAPFKRLEPLYKKDSDELMEFHFNFSVKLDAKWIDLFWRQGTENFDASYMSFFTRYFACKYIVATKDEVTDRDMRQNPIIRKLYTEAENRTDANEYLGFTFFDEVLKNHPEYILTLDRVFDVFYDNDYEGDSRIIQKLMIPVWDKKTPDEGDDFYCNIH